MTVIIRFNLKRIHVIISGRVQGVFFRARTKAMAESLNLKGWVRNLPDGSVEAVFEGSGPAVDEAVEWCRKGPSHAVVSNLIKRDESYKGEFERFSVVY